jgi:putative phosphonate metabolism protein
MSGGRPDGDKTRYAIYFVPPPGSPLARFGAAWLGYDVADGAESPQPLLPKIPPDKLRDITAEPRRYGFHATLKPPFALAEGATVEELDDAAGRLARGVSAFAAPSLFLARIGGFWALLPSASCPALGALAGLCVSEIDAFRAPPSAAELARRRAAGLLPAQEVLLERWGYPYVMEAFRFHMTLTGRLDAEEGGRLENILTPLVEPLCREPLPIDAIALLRQGSRDGRFRLVRRYRLAD